MKIAVISDLHLGSGGEEDPFGHEDREFLRFLDFLEGDFERVMLLGDVYETLWSRTPGDHAAELVRCREAHPEIVKRFDAAPYVYLHGNHDLVAAERMRAPERLLVEDSGLKILFTHGHTFDWILRRARTLADAGVWAASRLTHLGLDPVYRALERADIQRRANPDPERCRFQRWAIDVAAGEDADVIVTGHTHLRTAAKHGDRTFLNAGTCSRGQYSFLHLDTKTGVFGTASSW